MNFAICVHASLGLTKAKMDGIEIFFLEQNLILNKIYWNVFLEVSLMTNRDWFHPCTGIELPAFYTLHKTRHEIACIIYRSIAPCEYYTLY